MKVARHWAKEIDSAQDHHGHWFRLTGWGGSRASLEEARVNALAQLDRWKNKLATGQALGGYEYDGYQIREELIEEHRDNSGELIAAVTRNRYGALVLNAPRLLIADVDLPERARPRQGLLKSLVSLFTNKPPEPAAGPHPQEPEYLQHFDEFHRLNPNFGMRVYRTSAGFRVILPNDAFDPLDSMTESLLRQLRSDDLYIRLCRVQQCFRARLTPKPWRIGMYGPSNRYPRETADRQASFERWRKKYEVSSQGATVCELVNQYGEMHPNDTTRQIIELHDRYVLGAPGEPLA